MKIIENCWSQIETYNCQYGAHVFENSTAKIYVNHWLDVDPEIGGFFSRRNDDGFVGHCILAFYGVKIFKFSVKQWELENGKTVWREPVIFHYEGSGNEGAIKYDFEGSLHGFPSSVSIAIEAQKFELHILEKDEPSRQS
ncbi:hypothetical protein AB4156_03150 [Cupriavidus sp. 2MCAB6]|uniref:hypothetical protein n=1 Tax=Cupriavidus sp. 2MCAB6 TaxID=3232981 RepID=UPI003F8EBA06